MSSSKRELEHVCDVFDLSGFASLETNRCQRTQAALTLWGYFGKAVTAAGHLIWQWMDVH